MKISGITIIWAMNSTREAMYKINPSIGITATLTLIRCGYPLDPTKATLFPVAISYPQLLRWMWDFYAYSIWESFFWLRLAYVLCSLSYCCWSFMYSCTTVSMKQFYYTHLLPLAPSVFPLAPSLQWPCEGSCGIHVPFWSEHCKLFLPLPWFVVVVI